MLIIMKNGDVARFFQPSLNFKATWSCNIFKVDPAKTSRNQLHGSNDIVYALRSNAKRERVNVGKRFKKGALAFHYRHSCFGTDIAQSEDGAAVGYNCDQVSAARVGVGFVHVLMYFLARFGDSWRVRYGEIVRSCEGDSAYYFDFTFPFLMLA